MRTALRNLFIACLSFLFASVLSSQFVFVGFNKGAVSTSHTFTNVQRVNTGTTCSLNVTTCQITSMQMSTTVNHNLFIILVTYGANASKTISSVTSTACNAAWNIPSGTAAYESVTTGAGVAMAWCPDVAAVNTITTTMSAAPDLSSWGVIGWEFSFTGSGSVTQDDAQALAESTAANPLAGIVPVIGGTSDLILQGVATGGVNACSVSTYLQLINTAGLGAGAELVNTTSTTKPNWVFPTCPAGTAEAGSVAELALK